MNNEQALRAKLALVHAHAQLLVLLPEEGAARSERLGPATRFECVDPFCLCEGARLLGPQPTCFACGKDGHRASECPQEEAGVASLRASE